MCKGRRRYRKQGRKGRVRIISDQVQIGHVNYSEREERREKRSERRGKGDGG